MFNMRFAELRGSGVARGLLIGGAVSLFLCLVATGCATPPTPAIKVWTLEDRFGAPVPAIPIERSDLRDGGEHTVCLRGLLNEVVSFQLAVAAKGVGVIDLRVDDFVSSGGRTIAGNVEVFRTHSVKIDRWPGWHIRRIDPRRRSSRAADVLVPATAPIGGLPAEARPGETIELWVDVRIPKGTAPGRYVSTFHLYVDERPATSVDVALVVWPFMLPDVAGPAMVVDLDHRALFCHHVMQDGLRYRSPRIFADSPLRDLLEATLASTMRLLHAHRLSPQLPWFYPVTKVDADGRLTVDWSDYDRVVCGYVDGSAYSDRLPGRWWRIPFDETFPPPPSYGAFCSPMYSRLVREYLQSAAGHFAERGWLSRSFVKVPHAEQMSAQACEATQHFGYIAHLADPRLRVLSALFPQDMSGYGWCGFAYENLGDYVDIWAPRAQYFDRRAIEDDLKSAAWLTVDRPPYSGSVAVHAPVFDTRVLAWQGQAAAAAVYLGTANNWPTNPDEEAMPQACLEHDPGVLLYPGAPFGLPEPIPSVRLKRLRRGLQDLAYLELLNSRGKSHIAATVLDSLVAHFAARAYGAHFADGRPRGWIEDPYWWGVARRIMADELLTTLENGKSRHEGAMPTTIRWRRFMEATRAVHFDVTGVRIRPAGAHPDDGVEVECTVSITNRKRTPLSGTLRFKRLPIGWVGLPAARYVAPLAPGETRNVVLAARAGSLAWNEDGVRHLPLVFEGKDGFTRRLTARMCHLTAQQLNAAVVVDGDLGDWPTGVGNYGSDFLLICGEPEEETGAAAPTHPTLCFVGLTEEKLFFALRCAFDGRRSKVGVGRATTLEDLVPRGEDCVEILLDPSNCGTRSPADLYRIVIRPGGARWERGVTTEPPIAPRRHWPVTVRHAVRVLDDYWTAEVEVPMRAFPETYRHGAVWGLNVTRFDLGCQEYANWAGAVGNVYDPRSMGNMTVP